MTKVITDKQKIDELLTLGVENIYPNREALEKVLLSGKRIRLYCGFDPSAASLHIGNAIQINKLSQFQALGHEVIFLIGDFTGMIGDPTDKTAARKKLTREEVSANAEFYQQQASGYLKFDGENPAIVRRNSEWSDSMTFKDLIELSSNFTVQQMMIRDMFQQRIKDEKPIHLHEFLYPLAQGYDSVAMDVDLEVGGNDQMFNMMCGRDLMRSVKNKEKFVVTTKLLADDQGKKMGKSEGNAVFLNQSPEEMYGKVMSWVDGVLPAAFELCTKMSYTEIKQIQAELAGGTVNPRDYKMKLAYEMVKINYDEVKANEAQDFFIRTVQKKEIPDVIEEKAVAVADWKLIDLLSETGVVSSKSEAKRLIEQGGIKIKNEVMSDINSVVKVANGEKTLIQRGKRQFLNVIGK